MSKHNFLTALLQLHCSSFCQVANMGRMLVGEPCVILPLLGHGSAFARYSCAQPGWAGLWQLLTGECSCLWDLRAGPLLGCWLWSFSSPAGAACVLVRFVCVCVRVCLFGSRFACLVGCRVCAAPLPPSALPAWLFGFSRWCHRDLVVVPMFRPARRLCVFIVHNEPDICHSRAKRPLLMT